MPHAEPAGYECSVKRRENEIGGAASGWSGRQPGEVSDRLEKCGTIAKKSSGTCMPEDR